jgi:hypothetical protein
VAFQCEAHPGMINPANGAGGEGGAHWASSCLAKPSASEAARIVIRTVLRFMSLILTRGTSRKARIA